MSTVETGNKIKAKRSLSKRIAAHHSASHARPGAQSGEICDVAIIGAGPYGLSLAAHLRAHGASLRIFGKPLDTWRAHMPKDMLLKSEGFASSLSSPDPKSTLKAYCAERGIEYCDRNIPVSLDLFIEYADWFRANYVPALEEKNVTALEKNSNGYGLTLEDGERVLARQVVVAVGITWFKYIPEMLNCLPTDAVSHSFDHRDVSRFKGRDVVILGAGASAIDTAALLHDSGAKVRIVASDSDIRFHSASAENDATLMNRWRKPVSTIGPGWRSYIFTKLPFLFRFLPEALRLEIVRRHLGPAPGWFMRERIEGRVDTNLGVFVDAARMIGNRVALHATDARGHANCIECDHVIAATGYRPDLARVPFMPAGILARIETTGAAPLVSGDFETSVKGFYVIGPAVANSFGPLMRFMTGSEFVAPHLAKHLAHKFAKRV